MNKNDKIMLFYINDIFDKKKHYKSFVFEKQTSNDMTWLNKKYEKNLQPLNQNKSSEAQLEKRKN